MSCRSGRLWFSLQDYADSLGRPGAMQELPVDTKLKHEKCRDHVADVPGFTAAFAQTKHDKHDKPPGSPSNSWCHHIATYWVILLSQVCLRRTNTIKRIKHIKHIYYIYHIWAKGRTSPCWEVIDVIWCDIGTGSTRHQKLPALSQVGTMVYWAPEMYATCPHCRRIGRLPLYAIKQNLKCQSEGVSMTEDKNYGLKVDVWALGICLHCMVRLPNLNACYTCYTCYTCYNKPDCLASPLLAHRCGTKASNAFPFDDEQQVRTKEIGLHSISSSCVLAYFDVYDFQYFQWCLHQGDFFQWAYFLVMLFFSRIRWV